MSGEGDKKLLASEIPVTLMLNLELQRVAQRKYRLKYPDRVKATQQAYRDKNRDKINLKEKVYRESNPEKIRQAQKNYYNTQPIVVYRWRNAEGIVDYVGRGTLLRAKRRKTATWWTPEHTMSYMVCRNEWHSMRMEGIWGELFQPRYNKDGYRR